MERQHEAFGFLFLIWLVFYIVGYIPITVCRLALSLLGLFAGKWRTVGWPNLFEGAIVGLAIAWIVATPIRSSRQLKEANTYDYVIAGDKITFTNPPKEPNLHFKSNLERRPPGTMTDAKLFILRDNVVSTDKNKATSPDLGTDGCDIMVMDGEQVLKARQKSTALSEGMAGTIILVMGLLAFLAAIGRNHD